MFDLFNCMNVDGDSRLKVDLEILCGVGQHWFWSRLVALPSIIVWGLGIPLFAVLLLFFERAKLDSK